MHQKLVQIPVKKHIRKFLLAEYPHNDKGQLLIKQHVIRIGNRNGVDHQRYFQKDHSDKVWIDALTPSSRLYLLYQFIMLAESHFTEKLCTYVSVRYPRQEYSTSIREFLALYDIQESDYSYFNAYKKFQRSPIYKFLKNRQNERYFEAKRV